MSGNSLNNNFSTPGTYFADVVGVFAGRTVGPATCVAGTVNRGIVVSDVPNITFEINPNIGNDAGLCKASWTVSEGATSTCMIVTEFDERAEWLNSGNPFRGPAEGEQELPAGNEYRLKCTTQDSEETIISESHICIDPNLLEI